MFNNKKLNLEEFYSLIRGTLSEKIKTYIKEILIKHHIAEDIIDNKLLSAEEKETLGWYLADSHNLSLRKYNGECILAVNVKDRGLPSNIDFIKNKCIEAINQSIDNEEIRQEKIKELEDILEEIDTYIWPVVNDIMESIEDELDIPIYAYGRMGGWWGIDIDTFLKKANLDIDLLKLKEFVSNFINHLLYEEEYDFLYKEYEELIEEYPEDSPEKIITEYMFNSFNYNSSYISPTVEIIISEFDSYVENSDANVLGDLYTSLNKFAERISEVINDHVERADDNFWVEVILTIVLDNYSN